MSTTSRTAVWLYRLLIVGFVYLVFLNNMNTAFQSLGKNEVGNLILEKRFLFSPDLIVYEDPITGRAYPGMIDLSKFQDEERLKDVFSPDQDIFSAMLDLKDLSNGNTYSLSINGDTYRLREVYDIRNYGHIKTVNSKYVQIRDGDEVHDGYLRIGIILKEQA